MQGAFELAAKFFAVWKVELVFLHKELAVHLVGGVFDEQFVLVPRENYADRRVIVCGVLLSGKIAEVEVHLADIVMFDLVDLQVDQDEAAEDAVVEYEINTVVSVVDGDAVLPADKGEAFAKFEEKGLEVVAEAAFEISFRDGMGLRYLQEFEDERIAYDIGGALNDLPLSGELQDGFLVLARSYAQK